MAFRSDKVTTGKLAAGARALFRAGGVKGSDFGKPIIAVANSFTEFVPGHVHLNRVGRMVCEAIWEAGGIPREFNTIAIDDGIAMGHDGMLYSLPSRDLIADSIEYMVNGHCADALICISNCDKITPGMLMAGMRLNLPTIYVSGGPMEAGRIEVAGKPYRMDATDTVVAALDPTHHLRDRVQEIEENACPTCGSCSGMFTANSMNCLAEALGLALPGNGSLVATHANRGRLYNQAAQAVVDLTRRFYQQGDDSVLPRAVANRGAFMNAMAMDIAMCGSTNTILHLLAIAQEGEVNFTMEDIDQLSRRIPFLCKVAPATSDYFMEDVHKAGGVIAIIGELERAGLIDTNVRHLAVPGGTLGDVLAKWDVMRTADAAVRDWYSADASGRTGAQALSHETKGELDLDRSNGCLRDMEHAHSPEGGLAVLFGNIAQDGCIVKTGSVKPHMLKFTGRARVFDAQEPAVKAIGQKGAIVAGDIVVIRHEGPKGGPGMQEMLLPTTVLKGMRLAESCALITDGRFSGATSGLSVGHMSPESAAGGAIALIVEGDTIEIDIPGRSINLLVDDAELDRRRAAEAAHPRAWRPKEVRPRTISSALKVYAAFAASADRGGVRLLPEGEN